MSDSLRQDTSDKLASTLKPDEQKTTLEKAQDTVKSTADSVASTLQPESEKSTFQKASDTVSGTGTDPKQEGQTLLQQAQDVGGQLLNTASETLTNAANTVSETLGLSGEKK